ncbi:HEPN domain-containing protein [Rodentibacter abscessus]|uniref:HEPN domain-containing protein n=1 Tax=Rodentibacter abscessus TaxID=3381777 RepID=UPI00399CA00C
MSASFNSWKNFDKKHCESSINNIDFFVSPTKENIEEFFDCNKISGNIKKTFNVFELLGVELANVVRDKPIKDQITAIVNKRNDIIHRNDDAIDISLSDISQYIETVDNYMSTIKDGIINSIYITNN